ncbi:MAG: TetR family transcriptional regulator [Solirubrobacteraceae bacterium]
MQANEALDAAPARTFTERTRRAQIVRAAIDTIAELGYANASYAQIAKRADLSSTGLISYHFDSRGELMSEVVRDVVGQIGAHMAWRLAREAEEAGEVLRRHIIAIVEFIDTHRGEMKALMEIFLAGGFTYGDEEERRAVSALEAILRRGQREGSFRRFDVRVMATLIQRALDGLPFLLAQDPKLDVRRYGTEVATAFDRATRAHD